MKALVAAARAASKLKQLHALLAMAICTRNRELARQLVKLGVIDVLAAIIASKEPGARPRLRQEVAKDGRLVLAAASALAQIAEWEEHRRHYGKLAFLRSVISLTRSGDIRVQLASVTILASLAQVCQNTPTSTIKEPYLTPKRDRITLLRRSGKQTGAAWLIALPGALRRKRSCWILNRSMAAVGLNRSMFTRATAFVNRKSKHRLIQSC